MGRAKIIGWAAVISLGAMMPVASGATAPTDAVAYINPDTGAATENDDVDPDSSCENPDRRDRQPLSSKGATERNVHVDACLFDADGEPFDGTVTFESRGRGAISACPDPDQKIAQLPQVMNGERVAYLHDHDGDGRNEHCHQTGYQVKDTAGDEEYHVRANNDARPGPQKVVFCFDPEQDAAADATQQPRGHGCGGATVKSRVIIRWVN